MDEHFPWIIFGLFMCYFREIIYLHHKDVRGQRGDYFSQFTGNISDGQLLCGLLSLSLTHLPLDKVAVISHTIFSDAFSRPKAFVLWWQFHFSLTVLTVYVNIDCITTLAQRKAVYHAKYGMIHEILYWYRLKIIRCVNILFPYVSKFAINTFHSTFGKELWDQNSVTQFGHLW